MIVLYEAIFLLLAFLDAEFTAARLEELGVDKELNPLVRWLCGKMPIRYGVHIGVIIPTFLIAAIGWEFSHFLTFMIGIRTLLFWMQQNSRFNAK